MNIHGYPFFWFLRLCLSQVESRGLEVGVCSSRVGSCDLEVGVCSSQVGSSDREAWIYSSQLPLCDKQILLNIILCIFTLLFIYFRRKVEEYCLRNFLANYSLCKLTPLANIKILRRLLLHIFFVGGIKDRKQITRSDRDAFCA